MTAPDWLDELVLEPGPPWLSMGTHALELARWLLPEDDRDEQMREKLRLVDERHHDVFAALASTDAASIELLEVVVAWLASHAPGLPREPDPSLHPLDAAGRLVQEDLCVLIKRDGAWHLDAASLCFPSYWRLADKLGKPIADVHAPVAHYADELQARVDRFLDRLRSDRPVWRRNWSVHDDPALFLPGDHEPPADRGHLYLRSEYQTLRRLPRTDAIVFTIRTQQVPLDVVATRPDLCARLAAAVRAWSSELASYKGRLRPAVLAALDQTAEM
jgi:hypothetical protein